MPRPREGFFLPGQGVARDNRIRKEAGPLCTRQRPNRFHKLTPLGRAYPEGVKGVSCQLVSAM